MRILLAGDLHGFKRHTKWIIRQAVVENCQVIVQLGDFGFWTHTPDGLEFIDLVDRELADYEDITMVVVRGNHDNIVPIIADAQGTTEEGFLKVTDRLFYAHDGLRWTWGGRRFLAMGGAYSIDKQWRLEEEERRNTPGELWFPNEEMTESAVQMVLSDRTPVDVILAHDHPAGANHGLKPLADPGILPTPARLRRVVDALKPSLYVHGHLHVQYTDHLRVRPDQWTTVHGLSCNPESANPGHARESQSMMVVDTDNWKW